MGDMVSTFQSRTSVAVLSERIASVCEKIDDLDDRLDSVMSRIEAIPSYTDRIRENETRISKLEDWQTWGLRILGSAFVVQTIALLYEVIGKQ